MEPKRRDTLVYALLVGIWLLVVAWQVEEHIRVLSAAKTDLRNRSTEIADTLSAVVHSSSFRGTVLQNRIGLVLNELTRTNELVGSAGVLSIALLNTAGDPVVTAGDTNLLPNAALSEGERRSASRPLSQPMRRLGYTRWRHQFSRLPQTGSTEPERAEDGRW